MELGTAMKTIRLLATVWLVGFTVGCASISYKPSLSLGTSPSSVHARVQMNQLADASPPDEKDQVRRLRCDRAGHSRRRPRDGSDERPPDRLQQQPGVRHDPEAHDQSRSDHE